MALELAKYQTLMEMFFAKHQPQLCIEYDKLFRQAAAQDHTLRWDTIKEDVYVCALTQRQNFRGQTITAWPRTISNKAFLRQGNPHHNWQRNLQVKQPCQMH